jgi:urease accessory protein
VAASLLPLLTSLQLADSFFPSGSYTLSHGIESYAQAGELDPTGLYHLTAGLVRHSAGESDAIGLLLALRAARDGDPETIEQVDRRLTAVKVAREPRHASMRLGRQVLALSRDVFDDTLSGDYLAQVRRGQVPGNQAIALGLLKAHLGVPEEEAVAGELYAFAASCVGAALRMSVIDHREVQRLLHLLRPVVAEVAADVLERTLADIGGSVPYAELMSMRHEEATARLFVS